VIGNVEAPKIQRKVTLIPDPKFLCGYDLKTGKLVRQIDVAEFYATEHHQRCYVNIATERFLVTSRNGVEYLSLDEKTPNYIGNWFRTACQLGYILVNGLQYSTSEALAR